MHSIGNAHHSEDPSHATTLTPDEQYRYMSMWSLMAAPLFFFGDMTKLDALTLNVLCNTEVIDIDQDSPGTFKNHFATEVPNHGVTLVKLTARGMFSGFRAQ